MMLFSVNDDVVQMILLLFIILISVSFISEFSFLALAGLMCVFLVLLIVLNDNKKLNYLEACKKQENTYNIIILIIVYFTGSKIFLVFVFLLKTKYL